MTYHWGRNYNLLATNKMSRRKWFKITSHTNILHGDLFFWATNIEIYSQQRLPGKKAQAFNQDVLVEQPTVSHDDEAPIYGIDQPYRKWLPWQQHRCQTTSRFPVLLQTKTLISLCSKFSNILNDCMKNQDLGSPRSELEQFSINQTNNSFYEILSCFISMDYSIKSHCHDHILMV